MDELKKCPCCGSKEEKPRIIEQGHTCDGLRRADYRAQCLDCGLMTITYNTEEEAIAAWNSRTNDFELADEAYDGLKVKYRVYKARNGEPVEGCFVLRPDIDSAARYALATYSVFCENERLSNDINQWLAALEGAGG